MQKTWEMLGISREQLNQQVVDAAVDQLMGSDDYGRSDIESAVFKKSEEVILSKVEAYVKDHLEPYVGKKVADTVLTLTNRFGETTGEPQTFKAYIVKFAEGLLSERTDRDGKVIRKNDYSHKHASTRLEKMIGEQLSTLMVDAFKDSVGEWRTAILDNLKTAFDKAVKENIENIIVGTKARR